MHEVMRKRILRKLEVLPEEQLYQVLDYIEFLETKYAARQAPEPSGLQRFAERLEDRMRARELAPMAMSGTMKLIGSAGRVLENLSEAGQGLYQELTTPPRKPQETGGDRPPAAQAPAGSSPPEGGESGSA